MNYVELKCKTNFSFLRGASHPHELVEQAHALGLPALAITDHGGVYAVPKAWWAAKNLPNFKLITGAELDLATLATDATTSPTLPLTLLAQNKSGYAKLCRMITDSKKQNNQLSFEILQAHLLNTTTSPFSDRGSGNDEGGGLVALVQTPAEKASLDATLLSLGFLKDIFNNKFKDNLYLSLGRWLDGQDRSRTQNALQLSRQFGLPIVATNDVHMHIPDRRPTQDILTAIREGVALPDAGYNLFPNGERYLKSSAQMQQLFRDLPMAIQNTLVIAESCTFSPAELRYRYPSEWIPEHHSAQSYLEELTHQGANDRYKGKVPDTVREMINHELALIKKLHFADYFLTIFEIIDFAKKKDILFQGRGSAANSVVCYCLGITAIDPIKLNLLFERFISEERNEPPDIDVDFEHERREEILQHIYEKYGRHRAAMVSAVVTYRRRSLIREIAKALDIPVGTLSAREVEKNFGTLSAESRVPNAHAHLEKAMTEIQGFPRHLSIHSGGFTLSADPIIDIVPVEPATMPGRTIIQWDKYDLDYLGLLKVDILSLGMLSAIKKTLTLVKKQLHEIPHEDPMTYEMICQADTVGTFQIESRAQMSMLGRLQPRNFYDLVIEVAIVRPGPIVGKMVHPYLKRRRGIEKVFYPHPKLKKILGKTLGIPLFQEQVMRISIELAGFTPGEADILRRAIGSWRSTGSIEKIGERLSAGLQRSGLTRNYAMHIFEQIKGFAEYGFPESHAASFALIAYASCYLKRHHPAEFVASVINSQPMGFYSNHTLIDDAKRHGVQILPLDIELSKWDCTMEKNEKNFFEKKHQTENETENESESKTENLTVVGQEVICRADKPCLRLGFRIVFGLSQNEYTNFVNARPYRSVMDCVHRSGLRKNILIRLAMGGAFRCFNLEPREALWSILAAPNRSKEQLDLFINYKEIKQEPEQEAENFWRPSKANSKANDLTKKENEPKKLLKPLTLFESISEQYRSYRLSQIGHPLSALRKEKKLPEHTSKIIRSLKHKTPVKTSGMVIVRQRPPTAKGVTFATLEDEFGFMDLIIKKEVYEKLHSVFSDHAFLKISGDLQKDGNTCSLLVKCAKPLPIEEKSIADKS